ncbi:hypothetical protein MtrunA17_Chr8g0384111 [Medicago truncatula]|uniref:Uncharacterized protein n=1 Tax=Medicago truncatula TaxID=3880 RepID=A0A396GRV9_MEDTR|nr:hypothetical protein MtrunA17_Chr8g0384111 [Medicago truncatula]
MASTSSNQVNSQLCQKIDSYQSIPTKILLQRDGGRRSETGRRWRRQRDGERRDKYLKRVTKV